MATLLGSRPTGISASLLSPLGSTRNTLIEFALGLTLTSIGAFEPSAIGLDCVGTGGPDAALVLRPRDVAPASTRNAKSNRTTTYSFIKTCDIEQSRRNAAIIEAPPD